MCFVDDLNQKLHAALDQWVAPMEHCKAESEGMLSDRVSLIIYLFINDLTERIDLTWPSIN